MGVHFVREPTPQIPDEIPAARPGTAAPIAIPVARVPGQEPRPAPVKPGERIVTLDVLRGVAVLGILLVNIKVFAFTFGDFEKITWAVSEGWDAAVLFFIRFFAQFKFITIFSLLFGMGLALQSERAAARDAPFVGMYSRRLAILLIVGLLHGFLVWYGDILSLYAGAGFIAMACRNVRSSRLLITAAILFVVPILVILGFAAIGMGDEFMHMPDWSAKAAAAPDEAQRQFFLLLADEEEIYRSGSFGQITLLRSIQYGFFMLLLANPMFIAWRCLALFMVGIVIIRKGILSRPDEHKRTLRQFIVYGVAVGVPLQIFEHYVIYRHDVGGVLATLQQITNYIGSAGLSFAYIGIIALICLYARHGRLLHALSCVGRMALTNYLMQSLICTTLFYGYGFGLFGTLSYVQALGVVVAIFGMQLVLSPIWLRYFRYGPFEWAWRTLTYMKVQPMRTRCEPQGA